MNIYSFVENTPEIQLRLVTAFHELRFGNPSVVNAAFRRIFEEFEFDYHKKGYSPKEITWRIENDECWNGF